VPYAVRSGADDMAQRPDRQCRSGRACLAEALDAAWRHTGAAIAALAEDAERPGTRHAVALLVLITAGADADHATD
jgi:hypothetical protein